MRIIAKPQVTSIFLNFGKQPSSRNRASICSYGNGIAFFNLNPVRPVNRSYFLFLALLLSAGVGPVPWSSVPNHNHLATSRSQPFIQFVKEIDRFLLRPNEALTIREVIV